MGDWRNYWDHFGVAKGWRGKAIKGTTNIALVWGRAYSPNIGKTLKVG